jgi:hypothetical protein
MKSNMKRLAYVFVAIASGGLLVVLAMSSNLSQKPLVVSYEPESPVSLHEPIFVKLTIGNRLNEVIKFDLGKNDKSNFSVTVTRPNGSLVRVPRINESGFGTIGKHSINPSGSYNGKLLMNEWFDFNEVGTYKVEISLDSPIQTVSSKRVDAQVNNIFTIQIEPRNPTKLQEKCEGLFKIIETSNNYSEVLEAATALSFINDEVAVPYLKKALNSRKPVGITALTGLGRIANKEATGIVKETLHDPRADVAAYAKWVLQQIAQGKPLRQTNIASIID